MSEQKLFELVRESPVVATITIPEHMLSREFGVRDQNKALADGVAALYAAYPGVNFTLLPITTMAPQYRGDAYQVVICLLATETYGFVSKPPIVFGQAAE